MKQLFLSGLLLICSSLFAQHQESTDLRNKLKTVNDNQLGKWLKASFELRYSNADSALYYGYLALEGAIKTGRKDVEADALRSLSTTYQAKGDYEEALDYGNHALHSSREIKDSLKTAHALNVIGMTQDQQGNFLGALQHYSEARKIYKNLGEKQWIAMIATNLGILFKGQGEYGKVIPYYREAYQIYNNLKMPAEAAFSETNLGSVYYYTQQYDSCIYYSLKAEKALLEQNLIQVQPIAQANVGLGYSGLKQWAKAKSYLEKALKAHRQYNSKKEIAFVLIHLAQVQEQLGEAEAGYRALSEARKIAEEIGSGKEVMDVSKLLSQYYASAHDYQRAYMEHVHYAHVRDTLFKQEKARVIAGYQIQYETEKKENENLLLKKENALKAALLINKNRTIYILVASALLVAALMFGWVARVRLRKKEGELKAIADLQKEKERIARDLHDNVGGQLSYIIYSLDGINEEGKEKRTEIVESINHSVRSVIGNLRETIWAISDANIKLQDFSDKLKLYARNLFNHSSMKVAFTENIPIEKELNALLGLNLYRVCQEILTNAFKHSCAGEVSVHLKSHEEKLMIRIADNGTGFDISLKNDESYGLQNIHKRAGEFGIGLILHTGIGKGTTYELVV